MTGLSPLEDTGDQVRAAGRIYDLAQGDLTDDAFTAGLFGHSRLHAVAHCAGTLVGRSWTEGRAMHERFHRMMDVNVGVPLQIPSAAIEHMAANGGGHIVLVGSVSGKSGGTSLSTPPDYAASKGAVHALVKWLSRGGWDVAFWSMP